MSLLFRLIFATACRSTHHKLAMNALRHLRGEDAERRRNLFLKHYEAYLQGSKAPDDVFKDFKNHVLHVSENYWGGAVSAAQKWYAAFLTSLKEGKWQDAAYAAGVTSHYFSDPLMPLHTGQTEEEGKVHRAAEWSIACGYDELQNIIERDVGYPQFEVSAGATWLEDLVRAGADLSHPHYHALIDHYDLSRGVANPPAGMDQEFKDRIAGCLAFAAVGIARILERGFDESAVVPPEFSLSVQTVLAATKAPLRWILSKVADERERTQIKAMHEEVLATGKAIETLPLDDKEIRKLHAEEVLKTPLADLDATPARATGQAHGDGAPARLRSQRANTSPLRTQSASPVSRMRSKLAAPKQIVIPTSPPPAKSGRKPKATETPTTRPRLAQGTSKRGGYHLQPHHPVKDAPTISAAAAKKFAAIGINTIEAFSAADAGEMAAKLADRRFDAETLRTIQSQVRLMRRIPGLRGHDAQILTASGIADASIIASMSVADLVARLAPFLATPAAARILRSSPRPDDAEVAVWIRNAQSSQPLSRAA